MKAQTKKVTIEFPKFHLDPKKIKKPDSNNRINKDEENKKEEIFKIKKENKEIFIPLLDKKVAPEL